MAKSPIDKLGERLTRGLARYTSRRSFIARLGVALAATPLLPLLPVARASAAAPKTDFERYAQTTDATKCNYWKYCASDGVLCSCCGGGSHTCPPGAEPSPISWIGTCVPARRADVNRRPARPGLKRSQGLRARPSPPACWRTHRPCRCPRRST